MAVATDNGRFEVEVAYARPDEQVIVTVMAEPGVTLEQAVARSGLLERFPEIDLERNAVGVFGKPVKRDALLRPRDRVEIYRPLIADPKEARRQRARR